AVPDGGGEAEADDPARRPVVTLLPGGHRRAEAGHPWIFSNEIAMDAAAKALAPGSLVTLRRSDERPLGVAMFNPHTLLAARLLDRDAARPIGKRFFLRHLERALRLRERLYRAPYYRLVHAEADGLPGARGPLRCSASTVPNRRWRLPKPQRGAARSRNAARSAAPRCSPKRLRSLPPASASTSSSPTRRPSRARSGTLRRRCAATAS